jgi:ABC-type Fe3+-hydroxamate transport system substrate-binding protein
VADVVDDLGTRVSVPDEPARIVSLVPNLSELLAVWGRAERVVAVTDWCVAPAGAFGHAERIRGPKNPDVAAIVQLTPDVVVANEEENRELDVRRLREAGVAVYVTRVRTVADAAASLQGLGRALGVATVGAALADELRRAGTRTPPGRAAAVVLCPIWRDPWMVVGRDTFAGDLLTRAGAHVWHPPDDARYPRIELEDARAAGVDVVLLPDEPYAFGERDRAVFEGWGSRVHLIDGAGLTWWGPRTPGAIRRIGAILADPSDAPAAGDGQ